MFNLLKFNFKARHSTFIFTILRTVEMLENVGVPVLKKVLLDTSVKKFNGFAIIKNSAAKHK